MRQQNAEGEMPSAFFIIHLPVARFQTLKLLGACILYSPRILSQLSRE